MVGAAAGLIGQGRAVGRALATGALLAALLGCSLVPVSTARAAGETVTTRALAEAVAAQIPGARVADAEDPIVGVPALADVAAGRAEVMSDPAFWTQVVYNLLDSGTVVLPKPIDLAKPELFLPTAHVAAGTNPSELGREITDLSGVTYQWQGRTKTLRDFMHSSETDGVAFVHRGKLVGEMYANGWSPSVRHQAWSVTKSFTSTLVGIALDEGLVESLQDPIERYIPELGSTDWAGTTIQNLLEMESGIHWDEGTPVLVVNTQVQEWIQNGLDNVTNGQLGQSRNEFIASLPRVAPQGTKFSYNSANTQTLGWMLERVYGKSYAEVLSEKLWVPLGMAGDARIMTDRVGDAIASMGLFARAYDWARFGELFRNGGRTPTGEQIVPEAWVAEATTTTAVSGGRYAYQWWAGATPDGYNASGFQGQKISVSPANCLTGVRQSHTLGGSLRPGGGNPTSPGSYGFAVEAGSDEWTQVYRAVAAHLGGC